MVRPIKQLSDTQWLNEQYVVRKRSTADIATELGCTTGSVSRALRRNGIKQRKYRSQWTQLNDRDWLYQKYVVEGLSTGDIASILGCQPGNVKTHLATQGIRTRTIKEARQLEKKQGKEHVSLRKVPKRLKDREWLVHQYVSRKLSLTQIAEEAGCTRAVVAGALKRLRIPRRIPESKYPLLNDKEWLVNAYVEQEMSTGMIAKKAGCHDGLVRDMLSRLGVSLRTYSEAQKLRKRREVESGQAPSNWKGGRSVHGSGYVFVYAPGHPNAGANNYVAEHRLIMAQKLGRPLESSEAVHHIDGDKQNNSPDNLFIVTRKTHAMLHKEQIRRMGEMETRIEQLEARLREYERLYGNLEKGRSAN